jgi:diaminopimelate decarboxylase
VSSPEPGPIEPGPIELGLLPRTAVVDADGRLSIGGVDCERLADDFGTPLYVYDEVELRERCREYRTTFPGGVAYASKAFLCGAMARLVAEEGLDLDVASGGELELACASGFPAGRIVVHGNNKSVTELRDAITAGVQSIVVDSFDEFDRIEALVRDESLPSPTLLVRVNPGIDAHTHEYLATGATDSKFGLSLESGAAFEMIERIARSNTARFAGLHSHIGSQIFRADAFEAALDRIVTLVREVETRLGLSVDELSIGGGLGVRYVAGDDPPSIAQHSASVHENFGRLLAAHAVDHHPRLSTEPGRSIAAPAGMTLYRVGTIKELAGVRTYVSIDGGISDNPRPALYGAEYETFVPTRVTANRPRRVTIAGKHCEQGDVLVRDAAVPDDLVVGDILATPCTGAYSHSMASNYNLMSRPAVIFVRDGRARLVVRRETNADVFARDVVVGSEPDKLEAV